MIFTSLEFLVFFLLVYPTYLILSHPWQNRFLIAASCVFYAAWNWKFVILMFISITTDYFCSQRIAIFNDAKHKKKWLFLSIFVNLSILGIFKYYNFFVDTASFFFSHALHMTVPLPVLNVVLPVGISFYTFEAISYTFDVYRGIIKPAKKYWDYVLFVIYFPHLVAGPIMRARDFLPQVIKPRIITSALFYEGCFLIFWGLFEKMFVADNLAKLVDPVFGGAEPYEGGRVLLALYAFAFQILCDFDGYSNIARGLGKCMGFEITINFKCPYFSTNPREFWQRWHISLSSWLRDYLYIPLGGNRQSAIFNCRNLLITMLLGGLWHGAAWTFVVWGLYHGALLIIYRFFPSKPTILSDAQPKRGWAIIRMFFFFHLVIIGWLFFRAPNIGTAWQMFSALLFHFHWVQSNTQMVLQMAMVLTPFIAIQIWQETSGDLNIVFRQHWLVKTLIYAFWFYLIVGYGILKTEQFIYFQF